MEQRKQGLTRIVLWAGQFLLCMLLIACALPGHNPEELDHVWNSAYVYFPNNPYVPVRVSDPEFKKYAAEQEGQTPLPAVIFLHGCEGFRTNFWEASFPMALAEAGYVVFVPDSFARGQWRKPACHHVKWDTVTLRHAEVDEAVKRMQALAWVDQRNLFLAGHSEGGIATALYSGYAFNAYFISGWICASRDAQFALLRAPLDKPVLAVIGDKDEYYPGNNGMAHCGSRMAGRPTSKSIVIPGYDHGAVPRDPAIGVMLSQFFDQSRVSDSIPPAVHR